MARTHIGGGSFIGLALLLDALATDSNLFELVLIVTVVLLAEIILAHREVTIRDNKATLFFIFAVGHLLVLLLLFNVFLVEVFTVLLCPLVLRVHFVVNEAFVALEWVPSGDHFAFLHVAPVEVGVGVLNDDAFQLLRCLRLRVVAILGAFAWH